jgi:hypothetical protein
MHLTERNRECNAAVKLEMAVPQDGLPGVSPQFIKGGCQLEPMPAIQLPGPYEFNFWSNEGGEPSHVHVRRDRMNAKFWLGPVRLARNRGFAAHELRKIEKLVRNHEDEIKAAWDEHFAGR